MCSEPTYEQLKLAMTLKSGDKVKLKSGQIAEFVKLNQKKFVGNIEGVGYNIPIVSIESIVEKVDQTKKLEEKINVLSQLKKGDWFYINKNGNALAFKFERFEGKRIIGINPISNATTKIDVNFEIGKIEL